MFLLIIYNLILLPSILVGPNHLTEAKSPHVINFRSPNLYPEGITYDPKAQHFIVGSHRHRTIHSVSDAGVIDTLIFDPDLPENTTFLGLAVDSASRRLFAVVNSVAPLPPFNALAAYDLRTRSRLFLSRLHSDSSAANDVTVDFSGNAYVTNSDANSIWKVDSSGEAWVFSESRAFTRYNYSDPKAFYNRCGLNGMVYMSKGYLLVVQSNTGKMFKVDAVDGTARSVLLNKDLGGADGIAVRNDGVILVASYKKLWFIKSDDSWSQGVVFDEIELDEDGFATTVVVGREGRGYVLYGSVREGILENGSGREVFRIEEVRSVEEDEEEKLWIYVLLGLGFAFVMFWRFQMNQLVKNMDKKTN